MLRRTEPTYPSFSLVVNAASEDPYDLPPYQPYVGRHTHPYSACCRTRTEDPLTSTVEYRYEDQSLPDDPSVIPELSWSDFWAPDEVAANLQAALENRDTTRGSISRRRRFSDLVIDLAHIVVRKCSVKLFKRRRKTNAQQT
ncbi:hypothetical protein NEOLEDRAFT_1190163 [Neolentinus lepideus HHB14362 ss-1]|uniref:Uncharacterized protein n=1 Tax=Neolentinus lepideus HHB14362 ss-1 TaxID=1314782 RepID=A0A165U4X4_9AGAM|nr:hypothetical protein NEOLEDRAFT_1190163 [Neolentinus lepideus HHB14362 ss-1]